MQKLSQLTLGLSLENEATFENFYPGKNNEIITALKKTASGNGERMIYLCATPGLGCSHLLQACCHYAHRHQLSSVYFPLAQLFSSPPSILRGLEALSLICLDDLQIAAKDPQWEEEIFHLYNRVNDAGGRIIFGATDLPKSIHLQLSDLVSRLAWGIIYQLRPFDDKDKLILLTLRANRRGITLTEDVAKYIMNHCPRHIGALLAALDVLDKASLAAQRRLTIPFVKEVLEI